MACSRRHWFPLGPSWRAEPVVLAHWVSSWRVEHDLAGGGSLAMSGSVRHVRFQCATWAGSVRHVRAGRESGWGVSRRVGRAVGRGVSSVVAAAGDFPLQLMLDAAPIGAATGQTGSNGTDGQQRDRRAATGQTGSNGTDGQQRDRRAATGQTGSNGTDGQQRDRRAATGRTSSNWTPGSGRARSEGSATGPTGRLPAETAAAASNNPQGAASDHSVGQDTLSAVTIRRNSGRLSPTTFRWSPSMRSMNAPPRPSIVNPPATCSGSPVAT